VDAVRLGSICRALRIKKKWRQVDVAEKAGTTRSEVSRLERGKARELRLTVLVGIIDALGGRLDFKVFWQGGELDRLLNARHSALHEAVAQWFLAVEGWALAPEISFSIRGERGIIDILAWHAATKTLIVIELKTEIVDVNELMGTVDRKRRLASEIARGRGWSPAVVSVWVIVGDSSTNRRRVRAHEAALRAAFPTTDRVIRTWVSAPAGSVAGLSFWSDARGTRTNAGLATVKRVRKGRPAAAEREHGGAGPS
jgi:transcriptional regulator with XRE-family HTH domain